MYIGMLNPPANSSSSLAIDCTSGNCTFPSTSDGAAFLSLGIDAVCTDTSSLVVSSMNLTNVTYHNDRNETLPVYYYAMPSGLNLTNATSNEGLTVFRSAFNYTMNFSTIATLEVMMRSEPDIAPNLSFECAFKLVVNTLSANITNGVLLAHTIGSQPMEVWDLNTASYSLLRLNDTLRNGYWHECEISDEKTATSSYGIYTLPKGYPFPLPEQYVGDLANASLHAANATKWYPYDCICHLRAGPTLGIAGALRAFLGVEELWYNTWHKRAEGSRWTESLYRGGNATIDTVRTYMKGLTDSMNTRLMQGDGSLNLGPVKWNCVPGCDMRSRSMGLGGIASITLADHHHFPSANHDTDNIRPFGKCLEEFKLGSTFQWPRNGNETCFRPCLEFGRAQSCCQYSSC